jgi:G3E family GTPase
MPFHPQPLHDYMSDGFENVVRSKGYFFIATRPEVAWLLLHAGKLSNIERAGYWANPWSARQSTAQMTSCQPSTLELPAQQEIVIIGRGMYKQAIANALDACLLTEEELRTLDDATIRAMSDPFPAEENVEEESS